MEFTNNYVVEKETKEAHVVANVLFLYCDKCDFNFQVSAVEQEVHESENCGAMINNVFICPECRRIMKIVHKEYGHFNKLNDYCVAQ